MARIASKPRQAFKMQLDLQISKKLLREFLRGSLDTILPSVCSLCAQDLASPAERDARLCEECVTALPGRNLTRCRRCALQHADACPIAPQEPPPWDAAFAAMDYAYPIDGWIHALKFQKESSLAHGLGWMMGSTMIDALASDILTGGSMDVLIPVPLSIERLAERGFNQAERIAKAMAQRLCENIPALKIVVRTKLLKRVQHSPALSLLPIEGRSVLVAQAYQASQQGCQGLSIGLVDDVMTTGATLAAATRALKLAGAKQVFVFVAARTGLH